MQSIVKSSYSISRNEAINEVIKLIGIKRLTESLKSVVEIILDDYLRMGEIVEENGVLKLP